MIISHEERLLNKIVSKMELPSHSIREDLFYIIEKACDKVRDDEILLEETRDRRNDVMKNYDRKLERWLL